MKYAAGTTFLFKLGLVAIGANVISCGKESDKNSTKGAAPIETTVVSESRSEDKVVLSFGSNVVGGSFLCKIDVSGAANQGSATQWSPCAASGLTVALPAGSTVTVSVKAVSAAGVEDASPLVLNYAGAPAGSTPPATQDGNETDGGTAGPVSTNGRIPVPGPTPAPGPQLPPAMNLSSLNLASTWTFNVPQGMHILQYAANFGLGAGIDALQIMQGQDPSYFSFYPGSFLSGTGCGAGVSQPVAVRSPSGTVLQYCAGKLRGPAEIANLFGFEYAPNHIEVGSDVGTPVQSRMIVQVYGNYQQGMGILNGLCGQLPNVSGIDQIFANVPVMTDFWAYAYLRDHVRTCTVSLNGLNGDRWQVAGFVFTEGDYAANYCRNRCGAGAQGALEVVYLERSVNGMMRYSDYFVRDFQSLIFNVLGRENPYMPF